MTRRAFLLLLLALPLHAGSPVIHVRSHGCTATVVESDARRTVMLTCAHAFDSAESRGKPVVVADLPGRGRLTHVDAARDLALLELPGGPYPRLPVARTAPAGPCLSAGYDLAGPLGYYPATLGRCDALWQYAAESPRHCRSGGPLLDARRRVVGVVVGFQDGPEGRRGVFVSHASLTAFLADVKAGRCRVPWMPPAD